MKFEHDYIQLEIILIIIGKGILNLYHPRYAASLGVKVGNLPKTKAMNGLAPSFP
jgi:hypothetical protein